MFVLKNAPSPAGQYPAILHTTSATVPAGCVWWPDSLEQETFLQYEGFVILDIQRNTVASYQPNEAAYEAWKAAQPTPKPTAEEVLETLLGVTE